MSAIALGPDVGVEPPRRRLPLPPMIAFRLFAVVFFTIVAGVLAPAHREGQRGDALRPWTRARIAPRREGARA